MELKDKIVIVTGSSDGIGAKTAIAFAKEGAHVVVTYNSQKKKGEAVLKECKKLSDCILINLNVKDLNSIKYCIEKVIDKFGDIDILINNSGVLVEKMLIEQSFDEIRNLMEVNLIGLINMTKSVLPFFQAKNDGIVINIASMAGKRVKWSGIAPYSASKYGVRGFTQGMAKEYESKNLRFYSVNPGMTATKMTDFEGVPINDVVDLIVNTAKENLGKNSGDDVDI